MYSLKLSHFPLETSKEDLVDLFGPEFVHSIYLASDGSHAFVNFYTEDDLEYVLGRRFRLGHMILCLRRGKGKSPQKSCPPSKDTVPPVHEAKGQGSSTSSPRGETVPLSHNTAEHKKTLAYPVSQPFNRTDTSSQGSDFPKDELACQDPPSEGDTQSRSNIDTNKATTAKWTKVKKRTKKPTKAGHEDQPKQASALRIKHLFVPQASIKTIRAEKKSYIEMSGVEDFLVVRDLPTQSLKLQVSFSDESQFDSLRFIIESLDFPLAVVAKDTCSLKHVLNRMGKKVQFTKSENDTKIVGSIKDVNLVLFAERKKREGYSPKNQRESCKVKQKSKKRPIGSFELVAPKLQASSKYKVSTLPSTVSPLGRDKSTNKKVEATPSFVRSCPLPKKNGRDMSVIHSTVKLHQKDLKSNVKKVCGQGRDKNVPTVVCFSEIVNKFESNTMIDRVDHTSPQLPKKGSIYGGGADGLLPNEKQHQLCVLCRENVEKNPIKHFCLACRKTICLSCIVLTFPEKTFSSISQCSFLCSTACFTRASNSVCNMPLTFNNGMMLIEKPLNFGTFNLNTKNVSSPRNTSFIGQVPISTESSGGATLRPGAFQEPEKLFSPDKQGNFSQENVSTITPENLKANSQVPSQPKKHLASFILPKNLETEGITKVINRIPQIDDNFPPEFIKYLQDNTFPCQKGECVGRGVDYHNPCREKISVHNNLCVWNAKGCPHSKEFSRYRARFQCRKSECKIFVELIIYESDGRYTMEFYRSPKSDPINASATIELYHNCLELKTTVKRKAEKEKLYPSIKNETPVALYRKNQLSLTHEQIRAGHTTASLKTVQKMVNEAKLSTLPDKDLITSLNELATEKCGKEPFIRQWLSQPHLAVLCYRKEVLEMGVNIVNSYGKVFCDGAEKFVQKIPQYDNIEMFCLSAKNPIIGQAPFVFAYCFLSKKGKKELGDIMFEPLKHFCRNILKTKFHPRLFVSDFSWSIIGAFLEVFGLLTFLAYVKLFWDVVNHRALENIDKIMFVGSCTTHFLRNIRAKLRKSNIKNKGLALTFFAVLAASSTIEEYHGLLENIMVIFYSKFSTVKTKLCYDFLLEQRQKISSKYEMANNFFDKSESCFHSEDLDSPFLISSEDESEVTSVQETMHASPFKLHALAMKDEILKSFEEDCPDGEPNDFYDPDFMDYFLRVKAVWPGWSMLTHGVMERHGMYLDNEKVSVSSQYKSNITQFFSQFSSEGMRPLKHSDSTNNTSELVFSILRKLINKPRRLDEVVLELDPFTTGHYISTKQRLMQELQRAKKQRIDGIEEVHTDEKPPQPLQREAWKRPAKRTKTTITLPNPVVEEDNSFYMPLTMFPFIQKQNNCWLMSTLNFLSGTSLMNALRQQHISHKAESVVIPALHFKVFETLDFMHVNQKKNFKEHVIVTKNLEEIRTLFHDFLNVENNSGRNQNLGNVQQLNHENKGPVQCDLGAQQDAEDFIRTIFQYSSIMNDTPLQLEQDHKKFFHCYNHEIPLEILCKTYSSFILINPQMALKTQLEGWKNPKKVTHKCTHCGRDDSVWESVELVNLSPTIILRVQRGAVPYADVDGVLFGLSSNSFDIDRCIDLTTDGETKKYKFKSTLNFQGLSGSGHWYTTGEDPTSKVLIKFSNDAVTTLKKNSKEYIQCQREVVLITYEEIPIHKTKELRGKMKESFPLFKDLKSITQQLEFNKIFHNLGLYGDVDKFDADLKKMDSFTMSIKAECLYDCGQCSRELHQFSLLHSFLQSFDAANLEGRLRDFLRNIFPCTKTAKDESIKPYLTFIPSSFFVVCYESEARLLTDQINILLQHMSGIFPSLKRQRVSYNIDGFFNLKKGVMVSLVQGTLYKESNNRDSFDINNSSQLKNKRHLFFISAFKNPIDIFGLEKVTMTLEQENVSLSVFLFLFPFLFSFSLSLFLSQAE